MNYFDIDKLIKMYAVSLHVNATKIFTIYSIQHLSNFHNLEIFKKYLKI